MSFILFNNGPLAEKRKPLPMRPRVILNSNFAVLSILISIMQYLVFIACACHSHVALTYPKSHIPLLCDCARDGHWYCADHGKRRADSFHVSAQISDKLALV
jgi:hypothetical protein